METLQFIMRVFSLLLHIVATAALVNWIGEYISQPTNILLVMAVGVGLSALVVLVLYNFVAVVNLFRKLTKTKKQ